MATAKRGHRQKKGRPMDTIREMLQQVNIEPTPAIMRRMKRAAASGDSTRVQQLAMTLIQESGARDIDVPSGGSSGADNTPEGAAGHESSDDEAPPPVEPPTTDSEEEPPPPSDTSDDEAPPPPREESDEEVPPPSTTPVSYVPRCEMHPQRKSRRRTKIKKN